MLAWIQPVLGVASAALVALIAMAFGAMFLFFSGASLLVLGQFVRFSSSLGRAAVALACAVAVWVSLGFLVESSFFGVALLQAIFTAAVYLVYRFLPYPWVSRGYGGLLLVLGLLYAVSLLSPELAEPGYWSLGLAQLGIAVPVLGFAPLAFAGLLLHGRERPVEWFVSLRYLVAKRRQTFISVISVICVLGVALGVCVITVVLSVMNGFSAVWEDKILGTRAHFVVQSRFGLFDDYRELRDRLAEVEGVLGATPYLETEAIVRLDGGELQAVLLKGIDTETVGQATKLRDDLREGSLENLDANQGEEGEGAGPGIVLGRELADRYGLRVGDPVVLISPMGGPSTPLGPAPRLARFRLAGVFQSDFYEFDSRYAYASLAGVQEFMRIGDQAAGVEARTDDPYRSRAVLMSALDEAGTEFWGRDWKEFYPGFFRALQTERVMMFVLLSFIMVVAGFIIIATLIMMIMEKSRDIAILKTMGCDDEGILRIFAIQGVLIGVGGMLAGLGMGLVITWNLSGIQAVVEGLLGIDVLPANVYQLQELPYTVVPWQLALISVIALVLAVGATLLPSWQAARLDPAEALRYE